MKGLATSEARVGAVCGNGKSKRVIVSAVLAVVLAMSATQAVAEDAAAAGAAAGGEQGPGTKPSAPAPPPVEKSIYDKIWGYTKLYNNPDNVADARSSWR